MPLRTIHTITNVPCLLKYLLHYLPLSATNKIPSNLPARKEGRLCFEARIRDHRAYQIHHSHSVTASHEKYRINSTVTNYVTYGCKLRKCIRF